MAPRHGYTPIPSMHSPGPAFDPRSQCAKRAACAFLALLGLAFLVAFWPGPHGPAAPGAPGLATQRHAARADLAARGARVAAAQQLEKALADKVLLELFVMSLCPDAKYCERRLAPLVHKLGSAVHVQTQ